MDHKAWSELPTSFGRYLLVRARWTKRVAFGEIVKEIVVVIAGLLTGVGAAIDHHGSLLDAALWGTIGGGAALALILVFFWCIAPSQIYKDQYKTIASMCVDFNFAAVLRERQRVIQQIKPLGVDDTTSLQNARDDLQIQQQMVIDLLHRPDNPWRYAPIGWTETPNQLVEWAGLTVVMEHRYKGEIVPLLALFDEISTTPHGKTVRKITLMNLHRLQSHASDLIGLIIREIEYPTSDYVQNRKKEPDDLFTNTISSFMPRGPSIQGSPKQAAPS